jgi:uncharacterized coiled-coil protein SlyX
MSFKLKRGGRDMEEQEITSKDVIGLTEDELKTQLAAGPAAVNELKTKVEEQGTVLDAIRTSLAGLEGRLPKTQQQQQQEENEDNIDPSMKVATYGVQLALEAKIDNVKNRMASNNSKYPYWEVFESDMLKLTEKDSLQVKTQEQYWDNVYSIIFARRYKEVQDGTIKAKKTMYIETGSSMSGGGDKKEDNTPSELDKVQALKFKIPIEKYMETKKTLQFQSR